MTLIGFGNKVGCHKKYRGKLHVLNSTMKTQAVGDSDALPFARNAKDGSSVDFCG
jgi:hypothetical protein